MDPLHFSIKRVYWAGHARINELVAPLGITPARADLLRVVALRKHGIGQSALTQLLGVSPPTTSKMLKAMLEKGWVERFTSPDGENIIHATRAGLVLIAQVIQRFVLSGAIPLRMAAAWGHGLAAKKLRATLYRLFDRARRALLDRAPFLHPWRNEETYVRRKYTTWEARLRADDIDDSIAEDPEVIRTLAKEPIAAEPPPRTRRELANIEAHRCEPATATPLSSVLQAPTAPPTPERTASAPPDEPPTTSSTPTPPEPDDDLPPALAQLWKNLVDLGGARGLSLEDAPEWDEPG